MARLLSAGALVALAWAAPLAPARAQTDTATTSFDVNGVKVILRRNTANDVVAANVYLLGGTQQLSPATQGIEVTAAAGVGARHEAISAREAFGRLTAALGSSIGDRTVGGLDASSASPAFAPPSIRRGRSSPIA